MNERERERVLDRAIRYAEKQKIVVSVEQAIAVLVGAGFWDVVDAADAYVEYHGVKRCGAESADLLDALGKIREPLDRPNPFRKSRRRSR